MNSHFNPTAFVLFFFLSIFVTPLSDCRNTASIILNIFAYLVNLLCVSLLPSPSPSHTSCRCPPHHTWAWHSLIRLQLPSLTWTPFFTLLSLQLHALGSPSVCTLPHPNHALILCTCHPLPHGSLSHQLMHWPSILGNSPMWMSSSLLASETHAGLHPLRPLFTLLKHESL